MEKRIGIKVLRYSVLLVAIIMISVGVSKGQPYQIFQQAIRICLECIGIG